MKRSFALALLLAGACARRDAAVQKPDAAMQQKPVAPPSLPPPESMLAPAPDMGAPRRTKCPSDMIAVPIGGCIDRYEASAGPGSLGARDGKGTTVVARSVAGARPLADVTVAQAAKACANAHKELCDESLWVSACKSTTSWHHPNGGTQYSYGNRWEARRCNDWEASEHGKRGAAATGSFAKCVSPGGAFDMNGNVAELVANAEANGHHVAFGGNYNMVEVDSECANDDYSLAPDEHHGDVGFRCCAAGVPGN